VDSVFVGFCLFLGDLRSTLRILLYAVVEYKGGITKYSEKEGKAPCLHDFFDIAQTVFVFKKTRLKDVAVGVKK
jgi:hypothetical protein